MSDVNENSENIDCLWWGLPAGNFPCDASPIEAVSFAVVCGGISLLFVAFLMKNVRTMQTVTKKCTVSFVLDVLTFNLLT